MLLFNDSKKLEKALGEEAAAVITHVFEKADEKLRQELATKADLRNEILVLRGEVFVRMAETKSDILRWMVGGFIAQSALLIAVMSFQR